MIHHEAILHTQVAKYLKQHHPDIIFKSDIEAGRKRNWSERQNIIKLNSHKSWPDIFIAEPRGEAHGLFIELKSDVYRLYLKTGALCNDEHVQAQKEVLKLLASKGYVAVFSQGYDSTIAIIRSYLGLNSIDEDDEDGVLF